MVFVLPCIIIYSKLMKFISERPLINGIDPVRENVSRNQLRISDDKVVLSLVHSHWSKNVEARLSLVESFIVLLRQLSYAIKNQLVAY